MSRGWGPWWGVGLDVLKNPVVHLLMALGALAAVMFGGWPGGDGGPLPQEHAARCKVCGARDGRATRSGASWEARLRAAGALE